MTTSKRSHILSVVLAGGEGRRLYPLTRDRAKPAVPFGGQYRLVDFALSNLANAGYRRIVVLTQYKSHSLDRHLAQTWQLSPVLGNYVAPVPAQMRLGPRWFAGSADAIYQNLNILEDEQPDYVIVFGSDHIYRMDPQQVLDQHIASGAGVTVAAIPVPIEQASTFGIIQAGKDGRIEQFLEKPAEPPHMPGEPQRAFASMGNYVFTAEVLKRAVIHDAESAKSRHDLGGNIIPMLVKEGQAFVYDFAQNVIPGQIERERGYWRDVGTLNSYYEASMDLVQVQPVFDLYNDDWPIYSWQEPLPPAKFVHDQDGRRGQAVNSLVSKGVIVSGGTVRNSILSPRVRVHSYASVEDSVLFEGVDVGRGASVRRAIIDKHVKIPPGFRIGYDPEQDRKSFTVSESGVVVIGRRDVLAEHSVS
jgi:glucose-1-phosphate adenylyltransferase